MASIDAASVTHTLPPSGARPLPTGNALIKRSARRPIGGAVLRAGAGGGAVGQAMGLLATPPR